MAYLAKFDPTLNDWRNTTNTMNTKHTPGPWIPYTTTRHMNTLTTILNKAKANGNNFIYAASDSDANNGIEWCVRNGYVTKTREEAEAAIRAEYAQMNPVAHACGSTPSSMWIWSVDEELAANA